MYSRYSIPRVGCFIEQVPRNSDIAPSHIPSVVRTVQYMLQLSIRVPTEAKHEAWGRGWNKQAGSNEPKSIGKVSSVIGYGALGIHQDPVVALPALRRCVTWPFRLRRFVDVWICGFVDWWIGGLVEWWSGGVVGFRHQARFG